MKWFNHLNRRNTDFEQNPNIKLFIAFLYSETGTNKKDVANGKKHLKSQIDSNCLQKEIQRCSILNKFDPGIEILSFQNE